MNQSGFIWDVPHQPVSQEERATCVTMQVPHHGTVPQLWMRQAPQLNHIHPVHGRTQNTRPVLIPQHSHALPCIQVRVSMVTQGIQLVQTRQPAHSQPMFPAVELYTLRSQPVLTREGVQVYTQPCLILRPQQQAGGPQCQVHPAGPHNQSTCSHHLSQTMDSQYHTYPTGPQCMNPLHSHTTVPQNLSQPTSPQNLSQPTSPQNLSQPTSPQNLSQPTVPQNPSQPTSPQNLSQPTVPQNPSQPTSPQNLSQPTSPQNLSQPTVPQNPSQPTVPQNPSQPTSPQNLSQPTVPQNPSQPTSPQNLSQPTSPQNPSQPTSPQNLSQPTSPQNLSQPTSPQNPSQPTSPQNLSQPSQPARVQSEQDRQRLSDELLRFSRLIITLVNFLNIRDATRVVNRILARRNTRALTQDIQVAPAA